MRKKKWKRIALWCFGIVIAIGIGGVIAANYAVNRVMDSFVSDLELDSESSDSSLSGNTASPESGAIKPADTADSSSKPDKSAPSDASTNSGKPAASSDNPGSSEAAAKPSSSNGGSAKPDPAGDVTTDKAKEVKESLTVSDKANAATILMKSLSASDIDELRELAKGGLTVEEKRTAKSILLNKLSESDYDKLSGLAKKYGVSKGRTYAEAKEEMDKGK
ncbi:hypothetical protein [Paenibacillus beijingensis]|uniref:hypothetical protein n=1 Tax=Paenibacillus beijingensis TaxID=1126833 RepID=UPI0006960DB2|nr:hypothetical protein [Paenibacillus beijingensis]